MSADNNNPDQSDQPISNQDNQSDNGDAMDLENDDTDNENDNNNKNTEKSEENNINNNESNIIDDEKNIIEQQSNKTPAAAVISDDQSLNNSNNINSINNESKNNENDIKNDENKSKKDENEIKNIENESKKDENKIYNYSGMEYRIQQIWFNNRETYRILQNVGGPCPLLGLCNVLLLNNEIKVNSKVKHIKFDQLTKCLENHLHRLLQLRLDKKENNMTQDQMANHLQNVTDAISLFPKLEQGLDINIKFNDCNSFEFTPAISMFDAYNIKLLHGWVVDPQDKELYTLIGSKSYNEVVDYLTDDDKNTIKDESNKIKIRKFLDDYKQQLTACGLFRMMNILNERELGIFFHNNHFSTIYKLNNKLYELVTDEGIIDADSRITWTTLHELNGDEIYLMNNFKLLPKMSEMQYQNRIDQFKNDQDLIKAIQLSEQDNGGNIDVKDVGGNGDGNVDESIMKQQQKILDDLEKQKKGNNNNNNNNDNGINNNKNNEKKDENGDENISNNIKNKNNNGILTDDEKRAYEIQFGLKPGEYDAFVKTQQNIARRVSDDAVEQQQSGQKSSNLNGDNYNILNDPRNYDQNELYQQQRHLYEQQRKKQKEGYSIRNKNKNKKKKNKDDRDCVIL